MQVFVIFENKVLTFTPHPTIVARCPPSPARGEVKAKAKFFPINYRLDLLTAFTSPLSSPLAGEGGREAVGWGVK